MAYPYDGSQSGGFLYGLIQNWQQLGLYDIILPFLLIFTISYAVLQKVMIFGKGAKKINVIIALVIALLFLQNSYLIFILQRFLPNMSLVMVVVLMFLLLVGIVGGQEGFKGFADKMLTIAFFLAIIITLVALSTDFFPGTSGYGILSWFYVLFPDPATQSTIILVIMIIVIIAFVTGGGSGDTFKKVEEDIKGAFGRKPGT